MSAPVLLTLLGRLQDSFTAWKTHSYSVEFPTMRGKDVPVNSSSVGFLHKSGVPRYPRCLQAYFGYLPRSSNRENDKLAQKTDQFSDKISL